MALPPQRHSPDAWLEHQEPVIHTAQNKREKKKKEQRKNKIKLLKLKIIIKKKFKSRKKKRTDRTLGQTVKAKLYRQMKMKAQ